MESRDLPIIRTDKSFKQMSEGDKFFVRVSKSGFSQSALCEFVTVEKGMVIGKVLIHYFPRGHAPFEELAEGNTIRKRAKNCFLWYQGESEHWPRYHWFKSLNEPVN